MFRVLGRAADNGSFDVKRLLQKAKNTPWLASGR
jgi:hypothetical protein